MRTSKSVRRATVGFSQPGCHWNWILDTHE